MFWPKAGKLESWCAQTPRRIPMKIIRNRMKMINTPDHPGQNQVGGDDLSWEQIISPADRE
jgi:hypothetical protein